MLMPLTLTLPPPQAFALLLGVAAVIATTGDLTSILVGFPAKRPRRPRSSTGISSPCAARRRARSARR